MRTDDSPAGSSEDYERKRYETQLVAACVAQDAEALRQFADQYAPSVLAAIVRVLKRKLQDKFSTDRVDDTFHEFWVDFMPNIDQFIGRFDADRGKLRSFVYAVADKWCRGRFRSGHKTRRTKKSIIIRTRYQFDDVSDRSFEALNRHEEALMWIARLKKSLRWIIEARWGIEPFDHAWSFHEIAQYTGWTVNKARRVYEKGMNLLREMARAFQGRQPERGAGRQSVKRV